MLDVSQETMILIERGLKPYPELEVYYSDDPETYTEDDYLVPHSLGIQSTSVSDEGGYEISNVTVSLLNRDYYFSRRFYYGLPSGKLAVIYDVLNSERIERFRGRITDWELTEQILQLQITA